MAEVLIKPLRFKWLFSPGFKMDFSSELLFIAIHLIIQKSSRQSVQNNEKQSIKIEVLFFAHLRDVSNTIICLL